MNTAKYCIYLLIFWLGGLAACTTPKASEAGPKAGGNIDKPLSKALLWKISHADVVSDSYLFGTIHIIDDTAFFLPPGTVEALESSRKVVFEVDLDVMTDMSSQLSLLTQAFMQDGQSLSDLLDEKDYQIVEDYFQSMGLPIFLFERIKPMFLSTFVSGDFNFEEISSGGIKSYEMEFYEIAQSNDIPVEGLESLEYQMSILDSIPYEEQAEMLVRSIQEKDLESRAFEQMIQLYRSQDIEKLYEMIQGDEEEIGKYEDILVSNRNKYWLRMMEEMMREGKTFFAVGAGHLGGSNGVIRLLMREGYTLTPILTTGEKVHEKPGQKRKKL